MEDTLSVDNVIKEFREYLDSLLGRAVLTPDHNTGIVGFITAALIEETEHDVGDIIIAVMYEGFELGKNPELWITFRWPIEEGFREDSDYAKFITKLQVGDEHPAAKGFQDSLMRLMNNALDN